MELGLAQTRASLASEIDFWEISFRVEIFFFLVLFNTEINVHLQTGFLVFVSKENG